MLVALKGSSAAAGPASRMSGTIAAVNALQRNLFILPLLMKKRAVSVTAAIVICAAGEQAHRAESFFHTAPAIFFRRFSFRSQLSDCPGTAMQEHYNSSVFPLKPGPRKIKRKCHGSSDLTTKDRTFYSPALRCITDDSFRVQLALIGSLTLPLSQPYRQQDLRLCRPQVQLPDSG